MSEFKFACPVCGQHITSSAECSGSEIECPTCFTKLVVPAMRTGDSKLIYSAAKVSDRSGTSVSESKRPRRRQMAVPVAGVLFVLTFVGAIMGAYYYMDARRQAKEQQALEQHGHMHPHAHRTNQVWHSKYKVPFQFQWTLNLTNLDIPTDLVAGRVAGQGFRLERAILQGGTLHLRQGKNWPPDLGISVVFFARRPEQLEEKKIFVWPERQPPMPKVVLRWKVQPDAEKTKDIREGYAMRVEFGKLTNELLPGKIYISLPDDAKSFAAGSFVAEVRRPGQTNILQSVTRTNR